jgi:hypothetical protein
MKILALVSALVLTGAADDLTTVRVKTLRLKVPASWSRSVEDGTHKFDSPSQDAAFRLDVFALEGAPLAALACRDKLVTALGGKWEKLKVAGSPAARKITVDTDQEKKVEVETYSYLGCDGKTKWALTFTSAVKKKERYLPLANEIVGSIQYASKYDSEKRAR